LELQTHHSLPVAVDVQSVLDRERRGDYLGKTVQVCRAAVSQALLAALLLQQTCPASISMCRGTQAAGSSSGGGSSSSSSSSGVTPWEWKLSSTQ
jgi:hypothetical protein